MPALRIAAGFGDLLRAFAPDRRGATAIEAAFTLPLVILLTFGAIELGRVVSAQANINHAVQETARFAAVRGAASGAAATEAQLETMALQLAELPADTLAPAVSWSPDNVPGSVVTVELIHTFTPITLPLAPDSFTFSSTTSMTIVR
ncbi:MAG TPA: TadE family protein [Gemmatimonadales bacterium]|nr:TadE family protein [Gemmatimonadales bacterium]